MTFAPQSSTPQRKKSPAVASGAPADTLVAFLSNARRLEALLFERRDRRGFNVVTALIDRPSGRLTLIAEANGLDSSESDTLRALARGPAHAPPLMPLEVEHARTRLTRAVMATRIAGGATPAWLEARPDLLGDARVDDVYLCASCDEPLPVSEQLARADGISIARCPSCRREAHAAEHEGQAWLGRAWLMLRAGEPRRSIVCAARAEGLRVAAARVEVVRAAAQSLLDAVAG